MEITIVDTPNPLLLKFLQQRQDLEKMEVVFRNQKHWLKKREDIENTLTTLQEEIEREFYQNHRKGKFEGEETLRFQEMRKKKHHQLQELRQVQFQIDEQLDQIEDVTEEHLHQQRFHLLQALWELYPARQEEQKTQWEEWCQLKVSEIEFLRIDKLLERIAEHLSLAIQARQSIKGIGILNYILGTSPNIIIEKQLFGIHALILNNEPFFKKMLHQILPESLQIFLQELVSWLEKLKGTCCTPWSFRHLDAFFSETKPILILMAERSNQLQHQISERIRTLNEEIHQWTNQL